MYDGNPSAMFSIFSPEYSTVSSSVALIFPELVHPITSTLRLYILISGVTCASLPVAYILRIFQNPTVEGIPGHAGSFPWAFTTYSHIGSSVGPLDALLHSYYLRNDRLSLVCVRVIGPQAWRAGG